VSNKRPGLSAIFFTALSHGQRPKHIKEKNHDANPRPAYGDLSLRRALPVGERLQDRSIIPPLHPGMTGAEEARVIAALLEIPE